MNSSAELQSFITMLCVRKMSEDSSAQFKTSDQQCCTLNSSLPIMGLEPATLGLTAVSQCAHSVDINTLVGHRELLALQQGKQLCFMTDCVCVCVFPH